MDFIRTLNDIDSMFVRAKASAFDRMTRHYDYAVLADQMSENNYVRDAIIAAMRKFRTPLAITESVGLNAVPIPPRVDKKQSIIDFGKAHPEITFTLSEVLPLL